MKNTNNSYTTTYEFFYNLQGLSISANRRWALQLFFQCGL